MFASQGIVQKAVMTYPGWTLREGEAPAEPLPSFSSASAGGQIYSRESDASVGLGFQGA